MYIVTVVCEENAMICFDSSPNVPVSVNVPASLPPVPNTVLNALFLNKLFYCALESTTGCLCPIQGHTRAHTRAHTHTCTHTHTQTNTLHPMNRLNAFSLSHPLSFKEFLGTCRTSERLSFVVYSHELVAKTNYLVVYNHELVANTN